MAAVNKRSEVSKAIFTAKDHEDSTIEIVDNGGTGVDLSIVGLGNDKWKTICIDKSLLLGLFNQFQKHHIADRQDRRYRSMRVGESSDYLFDLEVKVENLE